MVKRNNLILLLPFVLFTTNLFGQTNNTYLFIEPNISISYDSNLYKKPTYLTNTFYEKEAYEFELKNEKGYKQNIYISANHPLLKSISSKTIDSLMYQQLENFKRNKQSGFSFFDSDTTIRHIKDFSCVGIVLKDSKTDKYFIKIIGKHISPNDNTQIELTTFNHKSLDTAYLKLASFISSFKHYSKREIAYEDSLIKASYTISIYPTNDSIYDYLKLRNPTFLGLVTMKEKLRHKIKFVRVGNEIFEKSTNGVVPIICKDKEKGQIKKQGELVVCNSFGKKVKLPFSFTYFNN